MAKKMRPKSVVISDKVKGYGNDRFFVKKAKDSKAFLEEHGFPKASPKGAKFSVKF